MSDTPNGNGKKSSFMAVLAVIIITCSFSMFYMIMFSTIADVNRDVAMFVLGSVTTALVTVLNYYFGSSNGSAEKDQTIKDQLGKGRSGGQP